MANTVTGSGLGGADHLDEIRVRRMNVIWRDTFMIDGAGLTPQGKSKPDFLAASGLCVQGFPCYVADTTTRRMPDMLRVLERVSRNVAGVGYEDLRRFQFEPFQMANLRPTLAKWRCQPDKLTEPQVKTAAVDADAERSWIEVTPVLLLHKAGVGIMEYYATITAPSNTPVTPKTLPGESLSGQALVEEVVTVPAGYTPEEAIDLVRLGIYPQLLSLPQAWRDLIPVDAPEWHIHHMIGLGPGQYLSVGGLRDLSQLISGMLNSSYAEKPRRRKKGESGVTVHPPRPTGSATVVLSDIDPMPGNDLDAYVSQYAMTLRGIGAMDSYYRERAQWIIERELQDNLSTDAEMAVFLLGNSELLLFNAAVSAIKRSTRRRLHLPNDDLAETYIYMHYVVLLEWVYLQDAILRMYIQRLDKLSASIPLDRRRMIATLHEALADLVQYQEDITPYATRVEFLERARRYHKLDELGERFEHKQDLLLTYSSEYHDFREARAAEFLNFLAAILAGGELGNLIASAFGVPSDSSWIYLYVTLGSISAAFVAMVVLRLLNRR